MVKKQKTKNISTKFLSRRHKINKLLFSKSLSKWIIFIKWISKYINPACLYKFLKNTQDFSYAKGILIVLNFLLLEYLREKYVALFSTEKGISKTIVIKMEPNHNNTDI